MLDRSDFGDEQRIWMKTCITSASFAAMVKNWPLSFFKSCRGFRYGDPLSPLLFMIHYSGFLLVDVESYRSSFIQGAEGWGRRGEGGDDSFIFCGGYTINL